MSSSDTDVSQLSEAQQAALQQFTSVTDQEIGVAIPLLRKCEWNVQIAIARFFDGDPPDPVASDPEPIAPAATARRRDTLMNGFHDTARPRTHGLEPAPRITTQPHSQVERPPPVFLSLVVAPINIVWSLFSKVLNILSYMFPFLPRLLSRLALRPGVSSTQRNASARRALGPQDTTARFLREFEEEYGTNTLPFLETGYARAFDLAKSELKFLVVVPLSPEHDDTAAFVRGVLLTDTVLSFFNNPSNNVLLWAGSIQDSEAFQVANALNITTFPSAVVIAHTPSVSSTAMSVVARVMGPTTAETFITTIQNSMRTYSDALDRARSARAEQAAERSLRDQQNSAYERSLAQDRERARQKKEAAVEKQRKEAEEQQRIAQEEQRQQNAEQWRRWRASLISPEPESDAKDAVRISLRLLDGERVVRKFAPDATLEEVYAFVECHEILQDREGAGQSSEKAAEKPAGYEHEYGFRLVSPLPRQVYDLGDVGSVRERIGRSGNLIVEEVADSDSDNGK